MNKFKGKSSTAKAAKLGSSQQLKQSTTYEDTSCNTNSKNPNQLKWLYFTIPALALIVLTYYLLLYKGADFLYAIQENVLFVSGQQFFDKTAIVPGGFLTWLGLYFCQDFYYPSLGVLLLLVIWLATYFGVIKVFRLKGAWVSLAIIPEFMLLASIVIIGYFFYYLKNSGYWFKESLGLLIAIYLAWGEQLTSKHFNKWASPLYTIIIIYFGYHLIGWWALIFGLIIICKQDSTIFTRISSATAMAIIPYIATKQYLTMRFEDAWIQGFPLFQTGNTTLWPWEYPFFILIATIPIMAFSSKFLPALQHKYTKAIAVIAISAIGIIITIKSDNNTDTFIKELRMHRAAMEQRWDDVLADAANVPNGVTRQIVLLKDLALTQQGQFGNHFTDYDNGNTEIRYCDSITVHLAQTCGPLLYYSYGKNTFSTRWCIENSVEFGETVQRTQLLLWNALVSGEKNLAKKYIEILKHTKYYKPWAEKYEPILENPELIKDNEKYPELAMSKELYDHCGNVLDGDQGYVEIYLINYFSHTNNVDSKKLNEVTLNFACIQKDIQLFWQKFFTYAHLHKGEPMPRIYQEAAFLFCNLEREYDPQSMPFSQDVINRYNQFQTLSQSLMAQNKSQEEIGEQMKPMYGNTYWWFYFFCRGIKSY